MPFPVPVVGPIYNACKDAFLYFKGERQDIKDLEDRIMALATDLSSIISRKAQIDTLLYYSVTTEESREYVPVVKNIEGVFKKCTKYIKKYAEITSNLPSLQPGDEVDISTMRNIIEKLTEVKSEVVTFHFFKLAKLSRDVDKLRTRALHVLEKLKAEYMIQKKSEINQDKLHDDDYNLTVFDEYLDKVLHHLSENRKRVGITGTVGVGKTTVMKKLYNWLVEKKSSPNGNSSCFRMDHIIRTEYPGELEKEDKIFEKLQNSIMLQLNTRDDRTNDEQVNGDRISAFLRQKKYILLIDSVSRDIDLNKLGFREDHKDGCVVIASSDKRAVSLITEHQVPIERLSDNHAKKLFHKFCGEINDRRREIGDRIVECCGGLPRVIRLVATFLKEKDEGVWKDAKTNLQANTKNANLMGLGGIDYFCKERYKVLEPGHKKCLLYVALFPNEHRINKNYLIECWMAERFIEKGDVRRLRQTRDSGQTVLHHLIDLYLLEWCSEEMYVKIPPEFRRVALEEVYPDEKDCAIWVPLDDQEPSNETWTKVTRMSLIGCKATLPEIPKCCDIYTLLLQSKPELATLHPSFFFHMQKLQVLNLNHTDITALPKSISRLVNLKGLHLNSCSHLDKLPPEAALLKVLEVLDISGTSIPSLPIEIKFLINLRCLRASFSPRWLHHSLKGKEVVVGTQGIIPANIIKHLKRLEELSIDIVLDGPVSAYMAEQLATELATLEYLTTLCFNFPDARSFNKFVNHSKSLNNKETSWGTHTFRSFKIFVGCHQMQHPYESDVLKVLGERRLRFSTNEEFSPGGKEVLKQACALELVGNDHVETLSEFDLDSLKVCVIECCSGFQKIVDGYAINEMRGTVEGSADGILNTLEKLHLYDLKSLHCIWDGPVLHRSFINLTVLTLDDCPKLTKILDPPLALTLPKLKTLKVKNCCEVTEIVKVLHESNNSSLAYLSDILKSLETVELLNLPKLERICKNTIPMRWDSLVSMVIIRCSKLSTLPFTRTNATKLTLIECEESWWTQLRLPHGVKQHWHPSCQFVNEESSVDNPQGETSTIGRSVPQGEASTIGRSVSNQASSSTNPIMDPVEERAKQIMSSNSSSIIHPKSSALTDKPEVETSSVGRSVSNQASISTSPIIPHSEESSNISSIEHPASDITIDNDAEILVSDDLWEQKQMIMTS